MPINATYQRPPWVPPPHESSAGTVIPQLFAQGLARGQQQRQHEDEQRLREEDALRQQQVHERTTALASRRFAATAAFQDAMRRDLAMAETQVANLGEAVDEDTMSQIAARNFLLYGAAMNEGGGGSGGGLSSFIGRQQTSGYRDAQLDLKQQQVNQADVRLKQGWDRLDNADQALVIQEGNQVLRRGAAVQSATGLEARLLQDGMKPTVSGAPPGTRPPDASGNQPATGLVEPTTRPLTTAVVTASQESLRALEGSYFAIQRALQSVESTPEAFGPLGPVREGLEVARTLLFPGQPAPIASARATADTVAEDIIRGLKQDSQMSVFEKKQYDRLARITGLTDTPDRAKAKLDVVKVGIAGKVIRDALALGRPVPAWAKDVFADKADLTVYTGEELADAIKQGYITGEIGLAEFHRRRNRK